MWRYECSATLSLLFSFVLRCVVHNLLLLCSSGDHDEGRVIMARNRRNSTPSSDDSQHPHLPVCSPLVSVCCASSNGRVSVLVFARRFSLCVPSVSLCSLLLLFSSLITLPYDNTQHDSTQLDSSHVREHTASSFLHSPQRETGAGREERERSKREREQRETTRRPNE